jgi:hypothetical protein
MKTNQNLTRQMGGFEVVQRTKDGMFNATQLIRQWNSENPKQKRSIDNFWKSTHLDKLMSEIAKNELNIKSVDFTELKKYLSKSTRGKSGGTWMHPVLFIKLSMYLSPNFEYHVLRFVSDELLKYRNEAGDAYREMSSSIQKIVPQRDMAHRMQEVAKAINYIVYGIHQTGIRNSKAEEKKARELCELEKDVAKLINKGFIKNYDSLLNYLREEWRERHTPKMLISQS